jgi:hypothetical protein
LPEKPAKATKAAPKTTKAAPKAAKAAPKTAKAAPKATKAEPKQRASSPRRKRRNPDHAEIAERAYFIYLEEGEQDAASNWLRAERELTLA